MRAVCAAVVALVVGACGGDAGLGLADGFRAEVLAEGLDRPTQFVSGPDGRLWVAQLAGGEDAADGQVLAVPVGDVGEPEVLLDGLDKPTGLALLDQALWVQLERDLARVPLDGQGELGTPERVLTDLPYNGRSQGTLTVTPDRRLLFTTTGRLEGAEVVAGSGRLWRLDPGHPDAPIPFAEGFANAYGHAVDADGQVWATEVTDGSFDGEPAPEELNAVEEGSDHGWPHCIGDREPVEEHGGSEARCAGTERPAATFPAHATPTSVAVSPWRADELVVALWNTGQVVLVRPGGDGPADTEVLVDGLARPHHLLVAGSSLLIGDHERGVIYRVTRG
jgi:glucose/arabinose dehydrogenase